MFPKSGKSEERVGEAITNMNLLVGLVSQLPKEAHLFCGVGRFLVLAFLVKLHSCMNSVR